MLLGSAFLSAATAEAARQISAARGNPQNSSPTLLCNRSSERHSSC